MMSNYRIIIQSIELKEWMYESDETIFNIMSTVSEHKGDVGESDENFS